METIKKTALKTEKINLDYTNGLYSWFTKTVLSLYVTVSAILKKGKKIYSAIEYTSLVYCLWIVNHMARKLEGICSISSSVLDNCFCAAKRKIKGCICEKCYAAQQQDYQTGLKEHNILNGIILRNILIPVKYFKLLKIIFPFLRIESFGDTANVTQARNYIRIIKAFPEKCCAIWSKNLLIYAEAFKIEGKPKNTTYVHSSMMINRADDIDREKYNFVDHIFTVYDKQYIKKHNIVINCGGKKCMDCIKEKKNCYFRNTEFFINEALK